MLASLKLSLCICVKRFKVLLCFRGRRCRVLCADSCPGQYFFCVCHPQTPILQGLQFLHFTVRSSIIVN